MKYIVLMEDVTGPQFIMKWGLCNTLEDIEDFKQIYLNKYPNATFKSFEIAKEL